MDFLLFLQNMREITGSIFDPFFLKITCLGESTITFMLLAAVYWCVNKRVGQYMYFNVTFACSLNQVLKRVFHIERPWVRDERIKPVEAALPGAGGYSFPSGHVARTVASWGALGTASCKNSENSKNSKILGGLFWLIAGMIMLSRNYLGVHTPQDVIASLLLGIVILFLTDKIMEWADQEKNRDIMVAAAGGILLFLPMLRYGCLSNTGAGYGFLFGWVLERHFIRFQAETGKIEGMIRLVTGEVLLFLLLTGMTPMLAVWMPSQYAGFFMMFVVAVFITALYPFLFSNVGKKQWKAVIAILTAMSLILLMADVYKVRKSDMVLQQNAEETVAVSTENLPEDNGNNVVISEEATHDRPVKIIAHRGYSGVSPENTMSSFSNAIDIGADMIELDVQETKDGEIVVFHDDDLMRAADREGAIKDYTYEELSDMEVGSWFSEEYRGEKIPTLAEALELVKESELNIYLELKDIGEAEGFEEAVLAVVDQYGMRDRCLFASFRYNYLQTYEALDSSIQTLLNTTSEETNLAEQFDVDYYGLYLKVISREQVENILAAGRQAYVWTVNEPADMRSVIDMGVTGIVTNYPGRTKIVTYPEYSFLTDYYMNSIPLPGLYGGQHGAMRNTPMDVTDKIVQGLTKVGDQIVISAYSKSGEENSILYLMNTNGQLQKVIDMGFKAHVGGVSYDSLHNMLWITGSEGQVYALSWNDIVNGEEDKAGDILVTLDPGLVNHNNGKVASFLTVYGNHLYVGSYVDGSEGKLIEYDLSDPMQPVRLREMRIPQRIQGITFADVAAKTEMILTQGYQTEDAALLVFDYADTVESYTEPRLSYVLPEGIEQAQTVEGGMYLLFESGVRPYRDTARRVNDQIYLVNLGF